MDLKRLENSIIDNITEAQLKLGYDKLPLTLNYMISTLGHLLGTEPEDEKIIPRLEAFSAYAEDRLGPVTFRKIKGGFALTIPAKGTEYVHSHPENKEFISEFIKKVSEHGITLESVISIFQKYSENVTVSSSGCEDFDTLVYFTDGFPDDYRYCLSLEPCISGGYHISYHRFIPEDYNDFGF